MNSKLFRRALCFVPVAGATLLALVDCGSLPGVPGVPGVPGQCGLDLKSVDAVENFDFQSKLNLKADLAAKLKAGTVAAVQLEAFSAKIDGELKEGCGGIAHDLGAQGDFASGKDACDAAIKVMGEVKAKLGANAKIELKVDPPKCGVSLDATADCAAKCDATVKPGSAEVQCEPGKLQGSCSAECKGSCEMSAAATCNGTCNGSCDAGFKGTCGGKCEGKCDGKDSTGKCDGTCDGKCDASASGSCTGKCGGSCEIQGSAKCEGTCTGDCSVKMEAPKCTGKVTPPQMSADCKAKCDAKLQANAECTPAHVSVVITGAADAKAAADFQAAIQKNFGHIVLVAKGMGEGAIAIAGQAEDIVKVQAAVVDSVKAQGGQGAMMAANIAGCVGGAFTGVADAAASLKANVSVSASVSASASGSGSASGG